MREREATHEKHTRLGRACVPTASTGLGVRCLSQGQKGLDWKETEHANAYLNVPRCYSGGLIALLLPHSLTTEQQYGVDR